MNTLQQHIAQAFPEAYTPHNWTNLLPQFITHQLTEYHQQIEVHNQELDLWQQGDRSTPEPKYPSLTSVYSDACQLQALIEEMDFRILASLFYATHERLTYYCQKDQSNVQVNIEHRLKY